MSLFGQPAVGAIENIRGPKRGMRRTGDAKQCAYCGTTETVVWLPGPGTTVFCNKHGLRFVRIKRTLEAIASGEGDYAAEISKLSSKKWETICLSLMPYERLASSIIRKAGSVDILLDVLMRGPKPWPTESIDFSPFKSRSSGGGPTD